MGASRANPSRSPTAREHPVPTAAAGFAAGELVLLPTETGYVLAGSASDQGTLAKLRSIPGPSVAPGAPGGAHGLIWLAPSVEELEDVLASAPASHRRLVRRLLPGPAIFLVEGALADTVEAALTRRGAAAGAFRSPSGEYLLGVAGREQAAALVARASEPIASAEVLEGGRPVREAAEARRLVEGSGLTVARVVDGGEPPTRQPATIAALVEGAGLVEVRRPGAYEERFIRKQLDLSVLFVCTGNTCRSPMAEAIANGLTQATGQDRLVHFSSAGTGAGSGAPATPEAVSAVREMGYPLTRHASRPLTRRLIAEADVIYTMGRSHRAAVLEMDPSAADKVHVLDPDGGDVPDPVGMPQEVYTQTSKRLKELIARRLKELGT